MLSHSNTAKNHILKSLTVEFLVISMALMGLSVSRTTANNLSVAQKIDNFQPSVVQKKLNRSKISGDNNGKMLTVCPKLARI